MSARSENRYKANSTAKARQLNTEAAELETLRASHSRAMAAFNAEPHRSYADRRTVGRWMQRNSLGYENATELAEAAACVFDFRGGDPLSDETHWLWDIAADCFDC